MNSKDLEREDADVDVVAGRLPASWQEAVASWCDTRARLLTGGLVDIKEFEVKTNVFQVHALKAVSAYLGANLKKKPVATIPKPTKDGGLHYVALANLLCPPGWRETIKPVLDTLAETAGLELLNCEPVVMPCMKIDTKATPEQEKYRKVVGEKQPVGLHQAIAKETRRLVRFLQSVEAKGAEAQSNIDRRGTGSPQRRPGTLVRVVA